jgi:hypothetical protein
MRRDWFFYGISPFFNILLFEVSGFKVQRNNRQQIVNKHKIKHDYGNIV